MIPQLPQWNTVQLVMPEIWLVVAMCAVILVPFIKRDSTALVVWASLVGLALALVASIASLKAMGGAPQPLFHGMLSVDPFSQLFKILLIVFTALVIGQWLIAGRRETPVLDRPDFLCLLLGATVGMALMASASNLLMIFIATESASLPSFALAGWRKRHRIGSESSLKYVVFGAAASAIGVYGMSLVYGATGSLDLGTIASTAAQTQGAAAATGAMSPLLAVGLLAMFAGIAFKLSAVPLHFWCPDVFQGAPISVTTFLSVASKGAAVCLLLRVLHVFGASTPAGTNVFLGLGVGVGILGAVTATWGNLVALHQTNIKRLLAYSSIAHAGYMIMAASLVLFADKDPASKLTGAAVAGAILFYLLVYLFMNLGAFTVAALVVEQTGQEDIREYAGLIRRSPGLAICMGLFLLSLFGMPALGGFIGKIYLMAVMSNKVGGFILIAVLLVNTLLSLWYYMRPVYFMVLQPDEQDRPPVAAGGPGAVILTACVLVLLITGLFPGSATNLTREYGTLVRPVVAELHAPGPDGPQARSAVEGGSVAVVAAADRRTEPARRPRDAE